MLDLCSKGKSLVDGKSSFGRSNFSVKQCYCNTLMYMIEKKKEKKCMNIKIDLSFFI